MHQLIIRQRAVDQSQKQYAWYEKRQVGLGEDFLLSIEDCLKYIQRTPFAFQKKYKDIRVGLPNKFPFGIFYLVDNEKIIVLALFYLGQDPNIFEKLKK